MTAAVAWWHEPYDRCMTHALVSAGADTTTIVRTLREARDISPPVGLQPGLTEADAARIKAAIAAGRADSTRATYTSAWRRFERWSAARDMSALPATPAAVCAYLTEFAESGVATSTIEGTCAALADEHRSGGYPDPIASESVRQVRRGLRRAIGTAPRRQARPLSPDDIRQILAHIDRRHREGHP